MELTRDEILAKPGWDKGSFPIQGNGNRADTAPGKRKSPRYRSPSIVS